MISFILDRLNAILLIFLSTLLLNLALIFPYRFYFLVFIYLIPLLYLNEKKKLNMYKGIFWGIFFYTIHFYYLFILIYEKGEGQFRLFFIPIIILYFSIYSGIWFFLSSQLSYLIKNRSLGLIISTYLYIWFIYNYIFWIFQEKSGYVFSLPCLPLVHNSRFLSYLSICGLGFCICYILILNLFLYFSTRNKKILVICLMFVIIFLYNPLDLRVEEDPLKTYTLKVNAKNKNPYELAQSIKWAIIDLANKIDSEPKVILMPESSFPFALNDYIEVIEWWYYDLKDKTIHIILGSHRREGALLFNTVYHLYEGKIINFYDKTNLMFFSEKIPTLWKKLYIFNDLFLKDCQEFSSGDKNSYFNIGEIKSSVCICSDLFLNKQIQTDCDIILLFMNYSWFRLKYIRRLIDFYVILKRNQLNRPLICANF